MPLSAPHPCAVPGCPELVRGASRCEAHQVQARRDRPDNRPSADARGYTWAWRRYRALFLLSHPRCDLCGAQATVVDHIKAARGDASLFWDAGNHRPLCKPCHDSRTDEGDFGR